MARRSKGACLLTTFNDDGFVVDKILCDSQISAIDEGRARKRRFLCKKYKVEYI